MNKYYDKTGTIVTLAVTLIILLVILCSCSSTKSIEQSSQNRMSKEYVYRTDTLIRQDTLLRHDSIFVMLRGDTTYIERWHTAYQTKYKYLNKTDTICRTDTITKIEYAEKTIERSPSLWNRIKSFLIGAIAGIVGSIGFLFLKKMI